jgi:hypothetical protein
MVCSLHALLDRTGLISGLAFAAGACPDPGSGCCCACAVDRVARPGRPHWRFLAQSPTLYLSLLLSGILAAACRAGGQCREARHTRVRSQGLKRPSLPQPRQQARAPARSARLSGRRRPSWPPLARVLLPLSRRPTMPRCSFAQPCASAQAHAPPLPLPSRASAATAARRTRADRPPTRRDRWPSARRRRSSRSR